MLKMKNLTKYLIAFVLLALSISANAQDAAMADGLRSEGKIYVVVLIILIVLIGLIAYLFLMDRKLNRLEQQIKTKLQTKR
jgi:K+-transporting ATPase A subunit